MLEFCEAVEEEELLSNIYSQIDFAVNKIIVTEQIPFPLHVSVSEVTRFCLYDEVTNSTFLYDMIGDLFMSGSHSVYFQLILDSLTMGF